MAMMLDMEPKQIELTAETVTDERIEAHRRSVLADPTTTSREADDMVRDVEHARPGYLSTRARMKARARIAAAISASAKGGR